MKTKLLLNSFLSLSLLVSPTLSHAKESKQNKEETSYRSYASYILSGLSLGAVFFKIYDIALGIKKERAEAASKKIKEETKSLKIEARRDLVDSLHRSDFGFTISPDDSLMEVTHLSDSSEINVEYKRKEELLTDRVRSYLREIYEYEVAFPDDNRRARHIVSNVLLHPTFSYNRGTLNLYFTFAVRKEVFDLSTHEILNTEPKKPYGASVKMNDDTLEILDINISEWRRQRASWEPDFFGDDEFMPPRLF